MVEIYKDILGYEGVYQASNLGNIKSLKFNKEKVLKAGNVLGYLCVVLSKNLKQKSRSVHQLVAMAHLGHVPCGSKIVVNHINFNKADNRLENLEITTGRKNTNRKHLKSSSKYVGVSLLSATKQWASYIRIKGKKKHLGLFNNEYDAHLAYQKELKKLLNPIKMQKNNFNSPETAKALRLRVEKSKSKLIEIGAYKNGIRNFIIKYPEYSKEIEYLRNLWYCKSTNEAFTIQLEAFTKYKEVELI